MKKLRCLITEDEELARDLLENFINKIPHLELVAKCENPLRAMEVLRNETVDILFLDIQMPELTGTEMLKLMPEKPVVIFTTAYPSYALEGYQLDVTDYLLKPYSFERFVQAVNKATEIVKLKKSSSANHNTRLNKDYLLAKSEHKVIKIKFVDLSYIESMREYVAYHTTAQGRILSLMSLKKLEADLPEHLFIRIHKSYIVNIEKVVALEGNLVHLADKKLPIGASYKDSVMRKIF